DGTLHVIDMYRETIEHPWSIPDDIKKFLDLESGRDRGRIYRLSPPGFVPPKPPRLGRASTLELVSQLENANAWWRETAQRLLCGRRDPAAVEPLRQLLHSSQMPSARLHALYTLRQLGSLEPADLPQALSDSDPHLREHAVRVSEAHLAADAKLLERVCTL